MARKVNDIYQRDARDKTRDERRLERFMSHLTRESLVAPRRREMNKETLSVMVNWPPEASQRIDFVEDLIFLS